MCKPAACQRCSAQALAAQHATPKRMARYRFVHELQLVVGQTQQVACSEHYGACPERGPPPRPSERREKLFLATSQKKKPTTTQAIATYATNEPQYATRSLLSRSRVDWAIEAARRVGAEPVGALGEAGLRGRVGRCS